MIAFILVILFSLLFLSFILKENVFFGCGWYYGIISFRSVFVIVSFLLCYQFYIQNLNLLFFCAIIFNVFFIIFFLDRTLKILNMTMFISLIISVIMSISIVLCLVYKSHMFFSEVSIIDFLFGVKWNPDPNLLTKEEFSENFGILPLLMGTFLIVVIAMMFVLPLSLFSAIYISEYATKKIRYVFNTILEIISAIPSVVYGYFAIVFLSPFIRSVAKYFNFHAQSENSLVCGMATGIMILPFIISLLENAIRSVPKVLRYGSMALGATRSETIFHIVLPCALPSIVSAILLSVSRVIGETMIVFMAAGINANLTFHPLHSVTTITVQISALLTGDQNFNSVQTSAAYALGLLLFIITWLFNLCALYIVRRNNKFSYVSGY